MIYLARRQLSFVDDHLIEVSDDDAHYLFKVRRLDRDEPVFFYYADVVYETRLVDAKRREGLFEILNRHQVAYRGPRVFAVVAAFDWQRLEDAVRNGVEAGAHGFLLFHASRSTVTENLSVKRLQRLEQIIESAASQSKRRFIPDIRAVGREIIIRRPGHHIVFHPESAVEASPPRVDGKGDFYLWIGPEGGFGDADLFFFDKASVRYAAFRTPVLRVENAVTVAVAMVRHAVGYNPDIRFPE